jgi:hypothetical protein
VHLAAGPALREEEGIGDVDAPEDVHPPVPPQLNAVVQHLRGVPHGVDSAAIDYQLCCHPQ